MRRRAFMRKVFGAGVLGGVATVSTAEDQSGDVVSLMCEETRLQRQRIRELEADNERLRAEIARRERMACNLQSDITETVFPSNGISCHYVAYDPYSRGFVWRHIPDRAIFKDIDLTKP